MHHTLGECARQAPGRLSCSDNRRAQNAGPTESVPLWSTWEPEPEQLRPGKCMQPRARSLHSNLKPEQCRLGKLTHREQGQAQCCWDTVSTPHTRQWYLFAVFLPPHSTTEQVSLNKRPPRPLVSGRKLDTEETCKHKKPNKHREPLWKWQVQQIKIPVVNTDYTGRGLYILRTISWNKELSGTELTPHCPQQLQRNS